MGQAYPIASRAHSHLRGPPVQCNREFHITPGLSEFAPQVLAFGQPFAPATPSLVAGESRQRGRRTSCECPISPVCASRPLASHCVALSLALPQSSLQSCLGASCGGAWTLHVPGPQPSASVALARAPRRVADEFQIPARQHRLVNPTALVGLLD